MRDPGMFCCRELLKAGCNSTFIRADVLLNGSVSLAFPVTQVVAFVDKHNAITPHIRQLPNRPAYREHFGTSCGISHT